MNDLAVFMSIGYAGVCRLIDQNDEIAVYAVSYQENGVLPETEGFIR